MPSSSEGGSANEDGDIRDLENRAMEAAEGSTRPSLSCPHTECMFLMIMPITLKVTHWRYLATLESER